MNFTVEVKSGFCNTLKALVSALSIGEHVNILPLQAAWWPDGANWELLLDNDLICDSIQPGYESWVSARWLILKTEEPIQQTIESDTNAWGRTSEPIPGHAGAHLGINITNANLLHLFSDHLIDWSFDRSLICDEVFNRIQRGIQKIKWNNTIINEFNRIKTKLGLDDNNSLLTIQIRTWQSSNAGDIPNLLEINDGALRKYSFELYKNEIDKLLHKATTVFVTIDREDMLSQYVDYIRSHNVKVVTYCQSDSPDMTTLQHSAITVLLGSLSKYLVCSRLSTFSECMWWFGKCEAEVCPVG